MHWISQAAGPRRSAAGTPERGTAAGDRRTRPSADRRGLRRCHPDVGARAATWSMPGWPGRCRPGGPPGPSAGAVTAGRSAGAVRRSQSMSG
ncbi:hypothetical protein SSAG_05756 [Streptomyces sp. Mg1]|nr:hypothetical protein SSAG_05756 [Streptomyces sp. Mg1]